MELRSKQALNSSKTLPYAGSTVYLHYSPCDLEYNRKSRAAVE